MSSDGDANYLKLRDKLYGSRNSSAAPTPTRSDQYNDYDYSDRSLHEGHDGFNQYGGFSTTKRQEEYQQQQEELKQLQQQQHQYYQGIVPYAQQVHNENHHRGSDTAHYVPDEEEEISGGDDGGDNESTVDYDDTYYNNKMDELALMSSSSSLSYPASPITSDVGYNIDLATSAKLDKMIKEAETKKRMEEEQLQQQLQQQQQIQQQLQLQQRQQQKNQKKSQFKRKASVSADPSDATVESAVSTASVSDVRDKNESKEKVDDAASKTPVSDEPTTTTTATKVVAVINKTSTVTLRKRKTNSNNSDTGKGKEKEVILPTEKEVVPVVPVVVKQQEGGGEEIKVDKTDDKVKETPILTTITTTTTATKETLTNIPVNTDEVSTKKDDKEKNSSKKQRNQPKQKLPDAFYLRWILVLLIYAEYSLSLLQGTIIFHGDLLIGYLHRLTSMEIFNSISAKSLDESEYPVFRYNTVLGKFERNKYKIKGVPTWYGYCRLIFIRVIMLILLIGLVLFLWRPMISYSAYFLEVTKNRINGNNNYNYMSNGNRDPNAKGGNGGSALNMYTLYIDKTLPAEYVDDFLHDCRTSVPASTTPISSSSIIKEKVHSMTLTEAEKQIIRKTSTADGDGFGVVDIFDTEGIEAATKALVHKMDLKLGVIDERSSSLGKDDTLAQFLSTLSKTPTAAGGSQSSNKQKSDMLSFLSSNKKALMEKYFNVDGSVRPIFDVLYDVCGLMGQYRKQTTSIYSKMGCQDILFLTLEWTHNFPALCDHILTSTFSDLAKERGSHYTNAFSNLVNTCKEIKTKELERLAMDRIHNKEAETVCITNAHMGMTQPFFYVSIPGRESLYVVNPKIKPMSYSKFTNTIRDKFSQFKKESDDNIYRGDASVLKGSNSMNFDMDISKSDGGFLNPDKYTEIIGLYEPENTSMGNTDTELWKKLGATIEAKQPIYDFYISGWVLPTNTKMESVYGKAYGSALSAFITGHALVEQMNVRGGSTATNNPRSSEFSSVAFEFMSKFEEQLIFAFDEEASITDSIHKEIIKARSSLEALNYKIQNEAIATKFNYTVTELLMKKFYKAQGMNYETEAEADLVKLLSKRTPRLEYVDEIKVTPAQGACAIKSVRMNWFMDKSRQEYHENYIGINHAADTTTAANTNTRRHFSGNEPELKFVS